VPSVRTGDSLRRGTFIQPATDVYLDPDNDVFIQQESLNPMAEGSESKVIYISREYLPRLIVGCARSRGAADD
jgi:hypothetical protein